MAKHGSKYDIMYGWWLSFYLRAFTYTWINQQQYAHASMCVCVQFIRIWKFKHHMTNHSKYGTALPACVCGLAWGVCFSLCVCVCARFLNIQHSSRCWASYIVCVGITHPRPQKHSVKCPTMAFIWRNIRFSSVNWALHRNHKFIEINLITSVFECIETGERPRAI